MRGEHKFHRLLPLHVLDHPACAGSTSPRRGAGVVRRGMRGEHPVARAESRLAWGSPPRARGTLKCRSYGQSGQGSPPHSLSGQVVNTGPLATSGVDVCRANGDSR